MGRGAQGQNSRGGDHIKRKAVIVMLVDEQIAERLRQGVGPCCHAHDVRILQPFVDLKSRQHVGVLGAGQVGRDEHQEVDDHEGDDRPGDQVTAMGHGA